MKKLLYGRPGTGKTERALDFFIEHHNAAHDGVFLIVPNTRALSHTVERLLSRDDVAAVDRSSVLTLDEFAARVVGGHRQIASKYQLRRTLDTILTRDPPDPYAGLSHGPGFRAALAESLGEVFEEEPNPQELLSVLARHLPPTRAEAYATMYTRLRDELGKRGLYHRASVRREAATVLSSGEGTDAIRVLVVDGFFRLNTSDRILLTTAWSRSEHALVTVPCNPDDEDAAFASVREYGSWFSDAESETLSTGELKTAMQAISASLYRATDHNETRGLEVVVCGDEESVYEEAVRVILRARRDGCIERWSDAGLIVRTRPESPAVARAFARHSVPVDISATERLDATPTARIVRRFLSAMIENEPYEHPVSGTRADELRAEIETLPVQQAADRLRSVVLSPLLEAAINEGSLDEFTDGTETAKRDLPFIAGAIAAEAAAIETAGNVLEDIASDIDAPTNVEGLLRSWNEAISAAQVAPWSLTVDAVGVSGAFESRWWVKPFVVVANLVDGGFPLRSPEDIFLPDNVRIALNEHLNTGFRLEGEWYNEERALFLNACTRATRRLVLCRSLTGADGDEPLDSPFIDELSDCLGASNVVAVTREASQSYAKRTKGEIDHPDDVFYWAVEGSEDEPSQNPHAREARRAIRASDREDWREDLRFSTPRPPASIEDRPRERIRTLRDHVHASGMERLVRCPFLFYTNDVLGIIRTTPEVGFNARCEGEILHNALALLARDECDEPAEAVLKAWSRVAQGTDFVGMSSIRDRLTRWTSNIWESERERVANAAETETEFMLSADIPTIEWRIVGRADRVDTLADERVVVTEYKRGGSNVTDRLIMSGCGLHAQEVAYLVALVDSGKRPGGAVRRTARNDRTTGVLSVEHPYGRGVENIEQDALDTLITAAKARIEERLSAILSGEVDLKPDRPHDCTPVGCPVWAICRVSERKDILA